MPLRDRYFIRYSDDGKGTLLEAGLLITQVGRDHQEVAHINLNQTRRMTYDDMCEYTSREWAPTWTVVVPTSELEGVEFVTDRRDWSQAIADDRDAMGWGEPQ